MITYLKGCKMTEKEFENLKHGEKVRQPGGQAFMVHNNYRSADMVVVVRTEIISRRSRDSWTVLSQAKPEPVVILAGRYEVQIVSKL